MAQGPGQGLRRVEVRSERHYSDLRQRNTGEPIALVSGSDAVRALVRTDASTSSLITFDVGGAWLLDLDGVDADQLAVRVWHHPTGTYVGDADSGQPT